MDIKIDVVGESGDSSAHKLFQTLMQATSTMTGMGVSTTRSASSAVYASLGAALGSLQVGAAILSRREEGDEIGDDAINGDTMTLAICLLLVCAKFGVSNNKGDAGVASFEFGAQKYKEALSMFHRVTGRNADEKFSKQFVETAHEAISHLN